MTPAELHSTLTLFNPFLARQFMPLREEAEVNKAWHLGRKEFDYRQSLHGHIPLFTIPSIDTISYEPHCFHPPSRGR